MQKKNDKRIRLKKKIRAKIVGKTDRPRLSIFRSNKHIYAQIINDLKGVTLVSASDTKIKKGTKRERAEQVGALIAQVAAAKKIDKVVFDRSGFRYMGRVKLLAEAARKGGLKF
ncbi:MAG TPA: 50S ribosomal protein L18 [Candidatus Paceibacterota bacterium]|uniref:Large ribosomal subunit protein uL18 n=1 Tax=uncultured Parcubacteria bacterium Rifle_16ft_4_minimus_2958 TaxID=1665137 RepID=A0A0H4T2H2_9BACT|nr:50S ribosomal protein L18, large subunit ribosomal protein L18 [uncultured Parcubacteria bacterium Rifle_16ft_4_minimus_2958]